MSAAFQRQLRRVLSPTIPILVLAPPAGTAFKINTAILSVGGAVSLDNFGGAYSNGGLLPPMGAVINVGSIPLPTTPLLAYIDAVELVGSTTILINNLTLSGVSCTQVFFTDDFGVIYNEQAVFCPSGNTLYKFYLTYISGDTNAAQYQVVFQQVLNGAVLPQ